MKVLYHLLQMITLILFKVFHSKKTLFIKDTAFVSGQSHLGSIGEQSSQLIHGKNHFVL